MAIKTDAGQIQAEYEKGVAYNQQIDLYETVETNENFYIGKCWEGVNAPDLDKPVIPLLKRAVAQFVAMIVSDDISSQIEARQPGCEAAIAILQEELRHVQEDEKSRAKNRLLLRNAAVDGDCCLYSWFDPDAETGQQTKGRVRKSIINNTDVIFGNPHDPEVETQPYIILPMREWVDDVRREARDNGVTAAEAERIQPDEDPNEYNNQYSTGDLATKLIKLWRSDSTGTIWATTVCGSVVIRKPWDLEYRRYPLAYMPWDAVKNSYHGASAVAGLIQNQIFINKLYAMAMHYVKSMAFPKVAYDKSYLPGGISNKVGEAIGVQGDPSKAIFKPLQMADMSNQVFLMIDKIIDHTQNLIGASDVVLGNAAAENTSAIIALTKASTLPHEIQRLNFYQFVEDDIRVTIEIMATDYGRRTVYADDGGGNAVAQAFDFGTLKDLDFRLNIDVGESSYWSEITQIQTADNMWATRVITEPIDYLESLPDGVIPNKNKLIAKFKALRDAVQKVPAAPAPPQLPPEGGAPLGQ